MVVRIHRFRYGKRNAGLLYKPPAIFIRQCIQHFITMLSGEAKRSLLASLSLSSLFFSLCKYPCVDVTSYELKLNSHCVWMATARLPSLPRIAF